MTTEKNIIRFKFYSKDPTQILLITKHTENAKGCLEYIL